MSKELERLARFNDFNNPISIEEKQRVAASLSQKLAEVTQDAKITSERLYMSFVNVSEHGGYMHVCLRLVDGNDDKYSILMRPDGTIDRVSEFVPIDTAAVQATSLVQPFPAETPAGSFGYVMQADQPVILLAGQPFAVYNLYHTRSESHEPFGREGPRDLDLAIDGYVRAPECDLPGDGRLAFLLNRYAWGMNVSVALLDPRARAVYTWRSYNFDHPQGFALRRHPAQRGEFEIFISYESEERLRYSRDPVPPDASRNPDSYWEALGVCEDFTRLRAYVAWAESRPERLRTNLHEMDRQFHMEHQAGRIEAAAAVANEYLSAGDHVLEPEQRAEMTYNLARCHARLGQSDDAMRLLHSIESDWFLRHNADLHLVHMPDFDSLRSREDFQQMLARYPRSLDIESDDDESV